VLKKVQVFVKSLLGKGQAGELARGSALLLIAKVFGAVSGYVMAFVLTKRGDATAVGIYELAFTCIILLSVVARFGLDGAIVRYIGVFMANSEVGAVRWLYKKSMLFSALFSIALGGIVFLLAPWLSTLFGDDDMTLPFKWAAFAIPFFTLMNMNAETLRGFKRMVAYSFLQQGTVIFVAAIIFLLWWNPDAVGLSGVKAFFIASAVLFLISQLNVGQRFAKISALVIPRTSFNEVVRVAWPIFLSSSIFMIISWTDTLMIGYFLDKADVGVYRIAFRISTVITFTQFAINGIAAPMIATHYHKGDMLGLRKLIHKIGLFNFLFSMPIFLIIIFAPTFLLGLFGQEYVEGKNILLMLSFGQVVFALSGPVMYILTMTKHEKLALYIMYLTAIINLVGNAVLIPAYGLQGAAIATAFTTFLWNVLAVIAVNRYLGIVSLPFINTLFEKNRK